MPIVLVSTEGIETISAGKLPLLLRPQKGDGVGQREREREKSNYAARSVSGRQRQNHRKRGKETKRRGERNAVLACLIAITPSSVLKMSWTKCFPSA